MTTPVAAPTFSVIGGDQVAAILTGRESELITLVRDVYLAHEAGATINPPSYFLNFPHAPRNRIIALPGALTGPGGIDGIKWISSFPANVERGMPRASAVTILNDPQTGYPIACVEGAIISAARTAASAGLAASVLTAGRPTPRRLGIVGGGLIARYIHTYLLAAGFDFDEVLVHDINPAAAEDFVAQVVTPGRGRPVDLAECLQAELIVFATVSGAPYVYDPALFAHNPVVLGVSLRDLGPEVILAASQNIVDDVDHCLQANTSVHLVEQQLGHRDFISGTLAQVLTGAVTPDPDNLIVFSPFGLGVLDLAVAQRVYETVAATGRLHEVPGFFHDMSRLGATPAGAAR